MAFLASRQPPGYRGLCDRSFTRLSSALVSPMRRYLRVGLVGILCFVSGWVVGQFGTWHVHAQATKDKATPWFSNLGGDELMVRQPGEKEFTKDSTIVELEVYKDSRSGNLIYVTGAGAIAVVPDPSSKK